VSRRLKTLGKLAVWALAMFGAWQLLPKSEPVTNVYYETDFASAPAGIVGFPSFNARSGKDFLPGAAVIRQTSGGTLVLPEAASETNKVPAVVILHGSGGAWGGRSVNLAVDLARNGIAGFAVDTFTARNLRSTDKYLERLKKAPIHTQMADAMSALLALQAHPHIDTDRIGVTGFSLGAGATLYMMFEPVVEHVLGADGPRFSAYAMFYGGCMVDFDDFRVEGSPLLIMMGGADESMSIPACERFRDRLAALDVDVQLRVYEGAGHGWDNPFPQHFVDDAVVTRDCLMHWKQDGEVVEMTTGHSMDSAIGAMRAMMTCSNSDGYTMGFNASAFDQSRADLLQFLTTSWAL
jgi:dienelactone hydrolase